MVLKKVIHIFLKNNHRSIIIILLCMLILFFCFVNLYWLIINNIPPKIKYFNQIETAEIIINKIEEHYINNGKYPESENANRNIDMNKNIFFKQFDNILKKYEKQYYFIYYTNSEMNYYSITIVPINSTFGILYDNKNKNWLEIFLP